jgi:hypothetical protein
MKKREFDKKLNDMFMMISNMGEQVCNIMSINKNTIKIKCESHLKEYLQVIIEIITQGCTNKKLQLETPNYGGVPSSSGSSS